MTTTNNNATVNTTHFQAAKKAANEYVSLYARKHEVAAEKLFEAKSVLDTELSAHNMDTLKATYTEILTESNPIAAFCKRYYYSKQVAKRQMEKGTKELKAINFDTRRTRLNILDFIAFAENAEQPIENAENIKNLVELTAQKIAAYVQGNVQDEKGVSISNIKKVLINLINACGVPSVKVHSVDVRFLTYAVTKAKKMGELAAITSSTLAPYIMDIFHVQLNNLQYKFEEKEKEEEKEEETQDIATETIAPIPGEEESK